MRLPDDFWSVNEGAPGVGGIAAAFLVFAGLIIAIPALIWV